jgi:hypothetical protein
MTTHLLCPMFLALVSQTEILQPEAQQHFVFLFASQPHGQYPPECKRSHTFATYVCVNNNTVVDQFTISWIDPEGVRVFEPATRGINWSLSESFANAFRLEARVGVWGPYPVAGEHFAAARGQFERLERSETTKEVKYKVIDYLSRHRSRQPAIVCFHAVSDISGKTLRTWAKRGDSATIAVRDHLLEQGCIVSLAEGPSWLWTAIAPPTNGESPMVVFY